jgi:hypothetical protein
MINYLCKSNKTTYKAMYLLFIFVQAICAMAVKVFMKFRNIIHSIIWNRSVKVRPVIAEPLSMLAIAIAAILFVVLQGCAKVGNPTGGPEDINPPKYVAGSPENRSTNFSGDKIDITFDEYIQLKDQNREILISPPMKEKPLIRVKEKTIRITLNDELLPQTTYTLNFGNALSDLNESNILPDFDFVWSTGNIIDSLSVTGKVTDAFSHKPESEGGILVMLYENLSDSAPLVENPRYYGKANKNGLFSVNNIHPDTFRIIALKDGNNNLRYDPAVEEIAFLDSLLIVTAKNVVPQTFIKDTVKIIIPAGKPKRGSRQDTIKIKADTIIAPGKLLNALNVSLYYFLEESSKVFLSSRNRESSERFSFIFSRPPFDTLQITPLNFKPGGDWFMKEATSNNDSITFWITDTLISKQDTLKLKLSYLTTDSMGRFKERIDTVNMRFQSKAGKSEKGAAGRRAKSELTADKKKTLSLSGSISSRGTLNLNKSIVFTAEKPLQILNPEGIELYRLVDTMFVKQQFTCYKDSSSFRMFRLESKWEEESQYRLLLKPGTATDIYGITNDSLEIRFVTQQMDYYGRILLTLAGDRYPLVVQVLDEKYRVVDSKHIKKPGLTIFNYLSPRKYTLKAIFDANENGKWDTGNYLKHLQPEKIYLSSTPIQLRSNWDYEVSWVISE